MSKTFQRVFGLVIFLDGLLAAIFGRRYVRLFRAGAPGNLYRRAVDGLLALPAGLLRAGGLAQAGLGLEMMNRAPVAVNALYRDIAGFYAWIDPGWRAWFYADAHQAFDQALAKSLPEGGRVLDLGSGLGGNLSRLIALRLPYGSYTGVDQSPEMLQRSAQRYGHHPNVAFQQLDILRDPLPEGPFDVIVSTWVFEHLPDRAFAAQKAWARLKPGGRMILIFQVQANSLHSQLVAWTYRVMSVRLVRETEIHQLPGMQLVEYFKGPLGVVAVVTLTKPVEGD